jgi:RNA polymerase sigma-70 factor (ECF subfamily)
MGRAATDGEDMDRALVERARSGDHDAFATLATASSGRLFAVATLILRDQEAGRDAVQEALIAAWRGIRALRDPDAWEAWLHRLVVRSAYRLARRQQRFKLVELNLGASDESEEADIGLPIADRDQLERGFARLSAEQRAVLVLHYYLDLPLSEAANVLAIPEGTVKSRLHRATRAMRAALEADARGPMPVEEPMA